MEGRRERGRTTWYCYVLLIGESLQVERNTCSRENTCLVGETSGRDGREQGKGREGKGREGKGRVRKGESEQIVR